MIEVPLAMLADTHLPTLLVTLAHLTGDPYWLEERNRPARPLPGEDPNSGGLTGQTRDRLLPAAKAALEDFLNNRRDTATEPTPDELVDMLSLSLGEPGAIGPEYGELMAEELNLTPRQPAAQLAGKGGEMHVVIVGAGLSGLCAAIALQHAGIRYTVLERNSSIGGTWLTNTYPACGVDTPSHLYSYSFAQNAGWSRYFSQRDELYAYLGRVADDHGVRAHIRFGVSVSEASYEGEGRWSVGTVDAEGASDVIEANVLISGMGFFTQPSYPTIPGLERFTGACVHTASWDPAVQLAGQRVAVIGTGASAMQFVPATADVAEKITVFQRSAQWAVPPQANTSSEVTEATRWMMEHVPYYLAWYRLRLMWIFGDTLHPALQIDPAWPHPERSVNAVNDRHRRFLESYIESELGDRADELLEKCVPSYPPYGKRVLLDHGWFRTMARDDVELVIDPITEVRENCIVTASGAQHEVDVIVLATGFNALRVLGDTKITGRSGKTLRETWGEDDAQAYLGVAVPDFPNFFLLLGPNTFPAHGGSAAITIEMAMGYIAKLLTHMLETGVSDVEVRRDAHDAYLDELDNALSKTIWSHTGMTTYYRNSKGRIVIPMPWTNLEYWQRTHEPRLSDFHFSTPTTANDAAAVALVHASDASRASS